ncbi:hypothetical protein ABBQ38_010284 [Trebouxia sp. C0009 RCD-2024]
MLVPDLLRRGALGQTKLSSPYIEVFQAISKHKTEQGRATRLHVEVVRNSQGLPFSKDLGPTLHGALKSFGAASRHMLTGYYIEEGKAEAQPYEHATRAAIAKQRRRAASRGPQRRTSEEVAGGKEKAEQETSAATAQAGKSKSLLGAAAAQQVVEAKMFALAATNAACSARTDRSKGWGVSRVGGQGGQRSRPNSSAALVGRGSAAQQQLQAEAAAAAEQAAAKATAVLKKLQDQHADRLG